MSGKDVQKLTAETEVSGVELAAVLKITKRRVEQLQQDGVLVPLRRGVYNLADSAEAFYKNKLGDPLDEEDRKREKALRASEVTMKASKATIEQMKAQELKGTMHRAEDVAALTEDLVYTIRGALVALPGRLAVDIVAAKTPAEASEIIRKEVHKVLRELSAYHYDPKNYEERVRERMDWSERDGDDE